MNQYPFFEVGYKKKLRISMENYTLRQGTGQEKRNCVVSELERETYAIPEPNVALCQYTISDTMYTADNIPEGIHWSFAKDVSFHHTLYSIQDKEERYEKYQKAKQVKVYEGLDESFDKLPKLPSVYLLMMQAVDVITLEAYSSIIYSLTELDEQSSIYQKINDLSDMNVGLGMGKYSEDSSYSNKDFYMRYIGECKWNGIKCRTYDYYSEPSDVYVKDNQNNTDKSNKSIYSGRIYIDIHNKELIAGEMQEHVIPIGGAGNYSNRKIILESR